MNSVPSSPPPLPHFTGNLGSKNRSNSLTTGICPLGCPTTKAPAESEGNDDVMDYEWVGLPTSKRRKGVKVGWLLTTSKNISVSISIVNLSRTKIARFIYRLSDASSTKTE